MTRVKYFSHFVEFSLAVVSKTLNRESHIMKLLKCCWWAPIFLISKRRRQTQFKSFVSSGDMDLILKIVRASGNDLSRFFFYFLNPRIKVHKKIYIPFEYEDLTAESLNKSLNDFILRNTKNNADSEYKFIKKLRGSESFKLENHNKIISKEVTFSFKPKKMHKMLRIVSPFPVHFNPNPQEVKTRVTDSSAILIHIHGGGFISQSSSQHQVYLRRWSKQNNIPVFMITYTLSPEAPYPMALND